MRDALREFARVRDWEQFHSPRNLATAVAVEAGELLEHFQWLRDEDGRALDAPTRDAVALEAADVLLCLVRLADALDVDLAATARRKLEPNAAKYRSRSPGAAPGIPRRQARAEGGRRAARRSRSAGPAPARGTIDPSCPGTPASKR